MSSREESTNIISLNHAEFIVLGLIAENPSHAYNINKRIEERGMRNWTNIGRSSIYRVIKSLEKKGLTDKWIEEIDNRTINVYKITDLGSKILRDKVYKVISKFKGRRDPNYDVALSMYSVLSKEEQVRAFKNSLEIINNDIEMLIQQEEISKRESLKQWGGYPLNIKALFIRPIKVMETHIEFIEWMLKEIMEETTPWEE